MILTYIDFTFFQFSIFSFEKTYTCAYECEMKFYSCSFCCLELLSSFCAAINFQPDASVLPFPSQFSSAIFHSLAVHTSAIFYFVNESLLLAIACHVLYFAVEFSGPINTSRALRFDCNRGKALETRAALMPFSPSNI